MVYTFPEDMGQHYRDFIENRLYQTPENEWGNGDFIEYVYNLFNIYTNPGQPNPNRSCKACVVKTIEAVKAAYPQQ